MIATTPQALARGVTAQLVQKPRRVSPPQRRKKVSIIFSGDMRGEENTARPANPPSKKEYFLTATTPQALARGVSAQLVQKPRRVSPPERRKKVKSFSQATCAAKKIPLGLQTCAPSALGGRRVRCSRPQTLSSKKYYFFDKGNPAGDCLRGCLRVAAVYCIRGGPCPLGLPCGSGT